VGRGEAVTSSTSVGATPLPKNHTHKEVEADMPKNKTHSGAKKRFKVTGSGKIMRLQAGRKSGAAFASAPTTGSRKKHRRNAGMVELEKSDVARAKKMLGI
jgi:large subunit ribosomal protein L35